MEISSTMSAQVDKLTCPVCRDLFKTPKRLVCGHSVCKRCAQKLFQSMIVSCPVCKMRVSSWDTSVDELPTNYVLKALVDSDTGLINKESHCQSLRECPTHEDVCDQFCRTCEKQVCKQCIREHHQGSPHDTSLFGAVVVEQREVLDNLIIELRNFIKRLELTGSNITKNRKTCQSEADQLDKDINAAVSERTDNIVAHGESLRVVVHKDKKKILENLDDLQLKHSEVFLSASYVLDQCKSLKIDLNKNNLSRIAVMKLLPKSSRKIRRDLQNLEGKGNVLHLDLKFQSLTTEAKAGKLARKISLIPKAIPMEIISFKNEEESKTDQDLVICKRSDLKSQTNPKVSSLHTKSAATSSGSLFSSSSCLSFSKPTIAIAQSSKEILSESVTTPWSDTRSQTDSSLLEFLWPTPTWMIAVRVKTAGLHSFVKFTNLHFMRKTFHHEIGVEQEWSYASHSDYEGNFILCLCPGKVHKFSLPSNQNLREPGKIVSTVCTPDDVLGIAWDKVHIGCYALLNDGKTLLHVEFGGPEGFTEVAIFEEEITSYGNTHFLHVNGEGSMAICDHKKEVVYFFEKIEAEPTLTVRAPPDLQNPTPECVNTRRGEKLWYVLWKFLSEDGYVARLYAYDASFQLIGCVPNLSVKVKSNENRVTFCFQSDYVAVTTDYEVKVYALC